MNVVSILLQMFGLVGAPLIASVLIARAFLGRRRSTRACCGRCKAALSFPMMNGEAACAACGARVSDAVPRTERPHLYVFPLVLGVCFLALGAGAIVLSTIVQVPRSGFVPTAGTAVLVSAALNDQVGGMPETRELLLRQERGDDVATVSRESLQRALGPPESGVTITTRGALIVAGLVTSPTTLASTNQSLLNRILEGLFPVQSIDTSRLGGKSPQLVATLPTVSDMNAALTRVSIVRSVTVDGVPRGLGAFGASAPEIEGRPFVFDMSPPILLDRPLEPGKHVVTIALEQRLYRRFDAARLRDSRWRWRPVELWPEPLASRKHSISATVTIESDGSVRSSDTPPN